jgi:hypothetical protein
MKRGKATYRRKKLFTIRLQRTTADASFVMNCTKLIVRGKLIVVSGNASKTSNAFIVSLLTLRSARKD